MPVSISNFRSKFRTNPARASHFEVFIIPPSGLMPTYTSNFDTGLTYKTQTCEIPGRIIQTFENKTDPGPQRKIANGSLYNDVGIEIEVTEQWKERDFFQKWMGFITNDDVDSPIADQNFTLKYHDDYVGEVIIIAYNKVLLPMYRIKLYEAFPVSVAAVPMSWNSDDNVSFRVDFTYRYFTGTKF